MINKIGSNIAILYLKMLLVLVLNLFTVRLVYSTMGEENYGLFFLITGTVIMFQSVTVVVSTATQRYYSFNLGKKDFEKVSVIFSTSVNIYILFCVACLILGETVGLWFINNKLTIPTDKIFDTNVIYQLAIFSFIASILQTPFSAAVIAEEDMNYFAFISVFDCILKLLSIYGISCIHSNSLILYSSALLLISAITLCYYIYVCRIKYNHYIYKKVEDSSIYKDLLSFSGWNFFGSIAGVGINQIGTIIINVFFGLLASAARGISLQVSGALSQFSNSFITAIKPPLIKSYAENNFLRLNRLFNASNKCVYYLMQIISIPLFFGMSTVLKLWLNTTDSQTILFSKLIVVHLYG